ncbi:helix-turn-helix transcriptional regulator [Kineococcus rhizosphaerae]|uniref:Helix-turn-helix protein n=1 Tax=Kineococcus rhizosphaerae TaxID=559628 RepID=A0A2T0R6I3_9ACTN|nr:helix-turn-helix transcriptional regulator [Kineococcus rhizosphaerae]PRY16767.1 helix-turn-helix protein [Kineococcus rhizosphaerae]
MPDPRPVTPPSAPLGHAGELGAFLRAVRARLTPAQVGLVSHGARRVPGLRREELAQLAGVSPTYYARLEQGLSAHASDQVQEALADALRLDEDEDEHLRHLARPTTRGRRTPPRVEHVRAGTRQLAHAVSGAGVLVLDVRNDVLAWNRLGHALLAGHLDLAAPDRVADRPNLVSMLFCDPHTKELHREWPAEARRAVASLRWVAGQFPDDRALAELVGHLSIASPEFARAWSSHRVHNCTTGTKRLHHPTVGDVDLQYTVLTVADGSGHRLLTLSAAPGSGHQAALTLLEGSLGR